MNATGVKPKFTVKRVLYDFPYMENDPDAKTQEAILKMIATLGFKRGGDLVQDLLGQCNDDDCPVYVAEIETTLFFHESLTSGDGDDFIYHFRTKDGKEGIGGFVSTSSGNVRMTIATKCDCGKCPNGWVMAVETEPKSPKITIATEE